MQYTLDVILILEAAQALNKCRRILGCLIAQHHIRTQTGLRVTCPVVLKSSSLPGTVELTGLS